MREKPGDIPGSVENERLGVGAIVLSSVFALLVGLVVGVITTFTHGQLLPWGLVAGLAVVVALVIGFRLVFDSRIIAGAAAVGVLIAAAVLAFPGAGGTVLTLNGPAGWVWALGPAILSAAVVVWPRLGSGAGRRAAGGTPDAGLTSA